MSQLSKPDGTDPRIVVPSDDEPDVMIAFGHSTGRTYHTTQCSVVQRMGDPSEVSLSVAEWKGYDHCKRCIESEGGEGYDHPGRGPLDGPNPSQLLQGITPMACIQVRALLLDGHTRLETAERLDVGKSTVGRHALGKCNCDHDAHVLEYDGDKYVTTEAGGLTTHLTGITTIPPRACDMMRRAIVRDGVNAGLLATVFGIDDDTVRHHARGRCSHDSHVIPAMWNDATKAWEPAKDTDE